VIDERSVAAPPAALVGRAAARLAKQVELGLAETGLSLSQYRMLGLLSGDGRSAGGETAECERHG
jgi:hypothetical protein